MLEIFDNNAHVAGENAVWLLAAALVAMHYGRFLRRSWRSIVTGRISAMSLNDRLGAGIALVAIGALLHRGLWTIWRWLGRPDLIEENSALITAPAVALIMLGYGLHLSPYFIRRWPRYWSLVLLMLFVFAYLVIGVGGRHLLR